MSIICWDCKQELTTKETDKYNLENEDINRDTPYCDKCKERHKRGLGHITERIQ